MRSYFVCLFVLVLALTACEGNAVVPTSVPVEQGTETSTSAPATQASSASETPSPTETAIQTPTVLPAGLIQVDSLEQEVYPFVENGKCSLGEAIFAANAGEPKDSCAAGVPGETLIELMPGEYHFTQRDQTPPQQDWATSVVKVGDALPPVINALTIHGNGATLIRDEAAESFRFFEIMFGPFRLENITLQNGDVGEDWGGALYSSNASVVLDRVRFVNNHADNGGGVYFTFGGLTVQNGEFIENEARFAGGGIYLDSAKATFVNATFTGNIADAWGGGVHAASATVSIEDSLFLNNESTTGRGGALYFEHINLSILRAQFYQNHADYHGGAIFINNPETNGTVDEEGNPLDQLDQTPTFIQLATMIPGYQATLEAHPSGIFQDFHEDIQIHDSCFANNTTNFPGDLNWTAAISALNANAQNNYWGDPSGPSGMGPGTGDNIGKQVAFEPFQTVRPEYCDPAFSEQS